MITVTPGVTSAFRTARPRTRASAAAATGYPRCVQKMPARLAQNSTFARIIRRNLASVGREEAGLAAGEPRRQLAVELRLEHPPAHQERHKAPRREAPLVPEDPVVRAVAAAEDEAPLPRLVQPQDQLVL